MNHDELDDFRNQCERNLRRSVADRMRYGFNYVYKPVLDDAEWHSFDSMASIVSGATSIHQRTSAIAMPASCRRSNQIKRVRLSLHRCWFGFAA